MRILYWTPRFWPDVGGIQTSAMTLLPGLRARGHEIRVLTSHSHSVLPDETCFQDIPVYRFPFLAALTEQDPGKITNILVQVAKLKRSYHPELVHINFGVPSIAFFHQKTLGACRAPTLVSIHTGLAGLGAGPNTLLGQTLHSADWVTACSQATLSEARLVCPSIAPRSSVAYNGLPAAALEPAKLNYETPHVLCIGRLVREKGFDLAIDALFQLPQQHSHTRMTIAGDGPERARLERQARELGLEGRIQFPGTIEFSAVPALINSATMVVIPSRYAEPFPMVALEAAQMGRPIIAARVGGLPESVVDSQTGLLVEKEDPSALADAIAFMLEHPTSAERMGQAGRTRTLEQFSQDRFVQAFDQLYQMLAQGSQCAS